MKARKVTVTLTRYYSKQATVEVDVPVGITDEALKDYLTEDQETVTEIDNQLDTLLVDTSLSLNIDDDIYEFQDPTNNFGGHL